jgi:Mg-chelatase subunit ChlD
MNRRWIVAVVVSTTLFGCKRAVELPVPPKRTMPVAAVDPTEWNDEDVGGFGAIETRSAAGDPGHLRLAAVRVEATQAGDYADVRVQHRFVSDAAVQLEGTFRFPLPDSAIVTGLSMVVDGKTIEGELVDSARARKIYQEVVDSMQDPAIMEWEHGSTFKMRVFPIEPMQDKVVTLRYLVPLRTHAGKLSFVQGTRALDGSDALPELDIAWNGASAFSEQQVARGRRIELPAAATERVLREDREDGRYFAVRLRPDWAAVPAVTTPAPKRWVVVVDTSRSTLEEHALAVETLRTLLSSLHAQDGDARFLIATSDLETRVSSAGWQPTTADKIAEAVRFVETLPPDGATDLGAMLDAAGAAARGSEPTAVVYLGDCEASWGEVDAARLGEQAGKVLAGVPFYPLLLGDSVDLDLARSLASATAGRVFRARRAQDIPAFVHAIGKRGKRLTQVAVVDVAGSTVLVDGEPTLDEGEEVTALVFTPKNETAPKSLTLHAQAAGKTITSTVALEGTSAPMVARRYGSSLVQSLQRHGKPKDEVIAASIEYTVLSKHTAFLVLDSEEAYERFDIARRAQRANEAPEASIPHVDALDPDSAHISADHIQPGDPEIEIDAPRDAERVFVVLPNGDLKVAAYDEDAAHGRGAWVVRFLVDNGTPEGQYEARVFIEHADGRSETRTVSYWVDTTAPVLDARVLALRNGSFEILVTQHGTHDQVDLAKVEVLTPDGQTITLTAIRWGEFRGRWTPTHAVRGQSLHVIGSDEALNRSTIEVNVP